MQDQIRELCWQLVEAQDDPAVVQSVAKELRRAIHRHVESIRKELLQVPALPPSSLTAREWE